MRNPYDPTAEEIERWAYDAAASEPVQDWDIIALRDAPYRPLAFKLVRDVACPKRVYFLHVLYLTAGDLLRAIRLPEPARSLELDSLVRDLRRDGFRPLCILAERIEAVRSGKLEFSYPLWCAGGYARADEGLTKSVPGGPESGPEASTRLDASR